MERTKIPHNYIVDPDIRKTAMQLMEDFHQPLCEFVTNMTSQLVEKLNDETDNSIKLTKVVIGMMYALFLQTGRYSCAMEYDDAEDVWVWFMTQRQKMEERYIRSFDAYDEKLENLGDL